MFIIDKSNIDKSSHIPLLRKEILPMRIKFIH